MGMCELLRAAMHDFLITESIQVPCEGVLFSSKQCIIKQLLDSVLVIS